MCIILKTIEKIGNIKSRYRLKLIDFVGKSFATQGLSQTQKKGFWTGNQTEIPTAGFLIAFENFPKVPGYVSEESLTCKAATFPAIL